jgi:hypothetical protein
VLMIFIAGWVVQNAVSAFMSGWVGSSGDELWGEGWLMYSVLSLVDGGGIVVTGALIKSNIRGPVKAPRHLFTRHSYTE